MLGGPCAPSCVPQQFIWPTRSPLAWAEPVLVGLYAVPETHLQGRMSPKPQPGDDMIRLLSMVLVLLVFSSPPAHGPDYIHPDTLQVGVRVAPPFVIPDGAGGYDGLATRLWEAGRRRDEGRLCLQRARDPRGSRRDRNRATGCRRRCAHDYGRERRAARFHSFVVSHRARRGGQPSP